MALSCKKSECLVAKIMLKQWKVNGNIRWLFYCRHLQQKLPSSQ